MRGFNLLCFFGQSLYSQTYYLATTITGIRSTEGGIQIGLYNTKESFPLVDGQSINDCKIDLISNMSITIKLIYR